MKEACSISNSMGSPILPDTGILLQRFMLGLKTPISTQLLLRGKPDTFEKAIEAAREIEFVLEFEWYRRLSSTWDM